MIYDITTFNGEHELFEIRYNILKDYVDEFRVIEFDQTFSGKKKEKQFNQHWDKVKHYFITEDVWSKYKNLAWQSPNTLGAEHWKTEFMMKESIKDYLTDLDDEDTIMVSDCDEIWNPEFVLNPAFHLFVEDDGNLFKLKLRVYTYWLNNRSSEEFWGTIVGRYKNIKGKCLNYLRQSDSIKTITEWGWHFTNVMKLDKIRDKLNDSYTAESYNTPQVQELLEERYKNNVDYLGRNFIFKKDESELPKWLLKHKNDYKHLFR